MSDSYDDTEFDEEFIKSKTAIKAEMSDLQAVGVKLTELPAELLDRLDLDESLRAAVDETARITHKNARRRHFQYIGKLMRKFDGELVKEKLDAIEEAKNKLNRQLHAMEVWRDRLVDDADAVSRFVKDFPNCDRQQLRNLVRAAQKEKAQNKPPASARKLFKFIRSCYEQSVED